MKYFGIISRAIPGLFVNYPRVLINSFNIKKISRVKRYNDARKMIVNVDKALHIDLISTGLNDFPMSMSYIFTPNHQSFVDALVLIDFFKEPIRFVAKAESKKFPFAGSAITSIDAVYLNRKNLKEEAKTMLQIGKLMKNDPYKWIIFPEGTRTKNPDFSMNEFKPGALKSAMKAGIDIYPVAMWGSYRVLSTKYKLKRYPVFIHVFDPIKKDFYKNKNTSEVACLIQNMISEKLEELKKLDLEYLENLKNKKK